MLSIIEKKAREEALLPAMQARVAPSSGYVGCNAVLAVVVGPPTARLLELASLPLGGLGHRLVALRYLIANGATWMRFFAWEGPLAKLDPKAPARLRALVERIEAAHAASDVSALRAELSTVALPELAERIEAEAGQTDEGLRVLVAFATHPALAELVRERVREQAVALHADAPRVCDVLMLASYDLARLPATTVGMGDLRYVIVADKGEMGARAVREAVARGSVPVVLFSEQDDALSLSVRLAKQNGGFAIGLAGSFRESYANPRQIAERIHEAYRQKFGDEAEDALARSALYPGYGPLAENTAAIQHFRRHGIVFVGPTQDTVERAGDKRKFRLLAQSIDEKAVTPGIVMEHRDAAAIADAIAQGHRDGAFTFPGRLKAANGGGGRGQVVIADRDAVPAAVDKVLAEIEQNGWDAGVMFEQNIPETMHLEVQVVRDRFGNTCHFGMRDCSEQRASQKIQEEAPPALLRNDPALAERICGIATRIADAVGYQGACTVELMYKAGHFYLLEMNTRIQVEHPVTEQAHRVRTPEGLVPLNLVQLQLAVASGAPIPFTQSDVVCTHVAREFRINAESWRADLKDSRDGKRGLFLPNAGIFDVLDVPDGAAVLDALREQGVEGITDLSVRFDVGFEVGDKLVNKDPTFGKLIVAVATGEEHHEVRYELLRLASIEVLQRMEIEGRQVSPTGAILQGTRFETNLEAHARILETDMIRDHGLSTAPGRHVSWVVDMLRSVS